MYVKSHLHGGNDPGAVKEAALKKEALEVVAAMNSQGGKTFGKDQIMRFEDTLRQQAELE